MANGSTIRVLLADDHAIVLEGLRALLDGEPGIRVVAATTDGAEVLKLTDQHKPDVVVLDLQLGGMKGTQLLSALRQRAHPPKVLVLTAYTDGEALRSALDAGADGLALKTESPQQTLTAIRQVYAGRRCVPPPAAPHPSTHIDDKSLTSREVEVLARAAGGNRIREIGRQLFISDDSVKSHLKQVMHKLGARDQTNALCIAARRGFIRF